MLSDDPADHGLTDGEVACIARAYELRRHELRKSLARAASFEGGRRPFGVQWPTMLRAVFVPGRYLAHRRDVARRRALLRDELRALEGPPFLTRPSVRTLWSLWQVYGFEARRFDEAVCVELASSWVDRLYGPDTTQALRLPERLERVTTRRAQRRVKSRHLRCVPWVSRLEHVLREISTELPPYTTR